VVLGDRVDRELHLRVVALARAVEQAGLPGVREMIPAYATLTVFFDAGADADGIKERLEALVGSGEWGVGNGDSPPGRLVTIPTSYDGPDLEEVAERTGLTREEVIRRHAGREYEVFLLGFAPGWAYLGELDPALELPRRASPRTRVPAGSVAIAGKQTGVYPIVTPGGWHLIGRTDLTMFDPKGTPPALLAPGDRVRFEPVK
jgi:KipI family sensor histidine kinase inhibitor